jgi:ribosomal protein L32
MASFYTISRRDGNASPRRAPEAIAAAGPASYFGRVENEREERMLSKLAVTALILLLVWLVFFRRPRRVEDARPDRRALPRPLQLVRCERCGVYRLPGRPCACDAREGR